jgi:uncharacterized protein
MVEVRDVPEHHRYEAVVDGKVAGMIVYRDAGEDRAFVHTEVSDEFEGKGIGGALARGALDDMRARQRKVRPFCEFVAGWIRRHPDYLDVVADGYQDRMTSA